MVTHHTKLWTILTMCAQWSDLCLGINRQVFKRKFYHIISARMKTMKSFIRSMLSKSWIYAIFDRILIITVFSALIGTTRILYCFGDPLEWHQDGKWSSSVFFHATLSTQKLISKGCFLSVKNVKRTLRSKNSTWETCLFSKYCTTRSVFSQISMVMKESSKSQPW